MTVVTYTTNKPCTYMFNVLIIYGIEELVALHVKNTKDAVNMEQKIHLI